MKKLMTPFAACLLAAAFLSASDSLSATPPISEEDRRDYGYQMGRLHALEIYLNNLPVDLVALEQGLEDAVAEKQSPVSQFEMATSLREIDQTITERRARLSEKNLQEGQAFLEQMENKNGARTLDSGVVVVETLAAGDGPKPELEDRVKLTVHSTLWNEREVYPFYALDGKIQFLLRDRGPMTGLADAVLQMKTGDRWRIAIPPEQAFGEEGRPTVPSNAVLVLDVTLNEIVAQ